MRRDVIAANAVLAHVRDQGKLELLLNETAEEATHRMGLPAGLFDDILDADAGLPLKHLNYQILFALPGRCLLLGLGRGCLASFASQSSGCCLALAVCVPKTSSGLIS